MPVSVDVARNFKALRIAHDLSAGQLAKLLLVKSNASVINLEVGRSAPSYELLERYINLFACSLDWLLGRDSVIYTHGSMLAAERFALENLMLASEGDNTGLAAQYTDEAKREDFYSLPCRANILFLIHTALIPFQRGLTEMRKAQEYPDTPFGRAVATWKFNWAKFRLGVTEKDGKFIPPDDFLQDLETLGKLLNRSYTQPVYDVQKALEAVSEKQKEEQLPSPAKQVVSGEGRLKTI